MEFRTLKAEEIDVKVGNVTANGYSLLLYKNARVDMTILDETVGSDNWQRDHKEVKGNLYCGVGIWDNNKNQWIWKWDCGVESQFGDKEKGESSDSFKRACFCIGIGRELYTAPFIFIPCTTLYEEDKRTGKMVYKLPYEEKYRKFKVSHIEYNDKKEITNLTIRDDNGIAWSTEPRVKIDIPKTEPTKLQGKDYKFTTGKYKDITIGQIMETDRAYLELILESPTVRKDIKDNIREALK